MNHLKQAISYLTQLVSYPSVTPFDAGCQDYLQVELEKIGFQCTRYDSHPVSNLYAQYGTEAPLLIFAGHTDVVTAGDDTAWHTPPFELTEKENVLYGRGVADMKGGIAAMLVAAKACIQKQLPLKGSLGFLITSGEEGDAFLQGTPYVMQKLQEIGIHPNYCIVGEPSSNQLVGDTIKVGRRGSLTAHFIFSGKQGHVAYPHLADNPIHHASKAIAALADLSLDKGNEHFPPSTLQITAIQAGGEGNNVIPGTLKLTLNIRYNTEQDENKLKALILSCMQAHHLTPSITWRLSGKPFLTDKGRLLEATIAAIKKHTHFSPILSTSGGTSDGRFIAPYGIQVIELGLCNHTIHQVNECIDKASLAQLATLYEEIIHTLLL